MVQTRKDVRQTVTAPVPGISNVESQLNEAPAGPCAWRHCVGPSRRKVAGAEAAIDE